jgi:hypothetical protein
MIIILGLTIFIINILVLARRTNEGYKDMSNNECTDFTNTVYKNLYSVDISGMPVNLKDFKDAIKPFMQDTLDGNDTDKGFYLKYKNESEMLDNKTQKWLTNNIVDIDEYKDLCYTSVSSKTVENLENELEYTIKDHAKEDKKFNNVVETVKKDNPDIENAINILSGVDMNELNKLINKLNTFTDGFSKT